MSKLYIGNLPAECNEAALRQLLTEQAINVSSVLVKRGGYAFIDCAEQATIDRAIQQLNGNILLCAILLTEGHSSGIGYHLPSGNYQPIQC